MNNGLQLAKLVWDHPTLTTSQAIVLLAVADHLGNNENAWPGYTRLAAMTKLSRRTVITTVTALVEAGYLVKDTRKYKSNIYTPNFEKLAETATSPRARVRGGARTREGIEVAGKCDDGCRGDTSETTALVKPLHPGSETVAPGVVKELHQGSETVAPERPRERPTLNVPKTPPASRKQGAGGKARADNQAAAVATAMTRLLLETEKESIAAGDTTESSHGNLHELSCLLQQEFERHAAQNPWLSDSAEQKEVLRLTLQHQDFTALNKRCWAFLGREKFVVRLLIALEESVALRRQETAARRYQEKFRVECDARLRERGIDPAAPVSFFNHDLGDVTETVLDKPDLHRSADPFDDDLLDEIVAAVRAERAAS